MKHESQKQEIGKIWFVAHPYATAPVHHKLICPWNTSTTHRRKMLYSQYANYVNQVGVLHQSQEIYFVGEFECCSEVKANPSKKLGTSRYSNYHIPFFTELDYLTQVLNTDPFVFGDKFYYVCCKIDPLMEVGDIVIFGSYIINDPGSIIVDTVFVLDEKVYRYKEPQYYFPSAYYDATLCKESLFKRPKSTKATSRDEELKEVWIGRMFNENPNIFSFVPCKTTTEIDLPIVRIPGLKAQQNVLPLTVDDIQESFDNIKRQLLESGWLLGVRMEMPKYRDLNDPTISGTIGSEIMRLKATDIRKAGIGKYIEEEKN